MVSFSCEGCGDILTKKKLDPHRNQCWGASFTCLDCMVHFQGNDYRSHTSCISEAQKYQGALYKDKKSKQGQKNNANSSNSSNSSKQATVTTTGSNGGNPTTSQALVPRNAYVEDAPDAESGAVAIIDAPPRAPSPPPVPHSLGFQEHAALPPVNVFDFLDTSQTPNVSRVHLATADESRMIEDSIPPPYEERPSMVDVMQYQVLNSDDRNAATLSCEHGSVKLSAERRDSYNVREQIPAEYTTPAPKPKHRRNKSDKDAEMTSQKSDRKRKRNSPAELDMALVRAQQERDVMMTDAPPVLHSGLTGGLNRLLARPEFPPSPDDSGDYAEASPLSPMKRAKQGPSKALLRAQREWEVNQEKERRAEMKAEIDLEKERDRGRDRERKRAKESGKTKTKRRDDSARARRQTREEARRRHRGSDSVSPARGYKPIKTIEQHPKKAIEYRIESGSPHPDESALIVRGAGELGRPKNENASRAELFMSFVNKGPDSERGMSINKALKRYHRERYDRWDRELGKGDEEKKLWKSLRLKRNERGEIVLFPAADA